MSNFKKFLLVFVFVFSVFNFQDVYSAGLVPCGGKGEDVCTICHLFEGIALLIKWIRDIVVIAGLFIITLAGVMWIIGIDGMVEMAKKAITGAVIGIIVIFAGWLMIFFGLQLISAKMSGADNPNQLINDNWELKCSTKANIGGYGEPEPEYPTNVDCGSEVNTCKNNGTVNSQSEDSIKFYWKCSSGSVNVQCSKLKKSSGNLKSLGYSFDPFIESQEKDASNELLALLNCMSKKNIPPAGMKISSISDGKDGGVNCYRVHPNFPQCSKTIKTNCCSHSKNSCHYGGRSCGGQSYAVDFGNESYSQTISRAASECGASFTKDEGNHIHVSVGSKCGCQ